MDRRYAVLGSESCGLRSLELTLHSRAVDTLAASLLVSTTRLAAVFGCFRCGLHRTGLSFKAQYTSESTCIDKHACAIPMLTRSFKAISMAPQANINTFPVASQHACTTTSLTPSCPSNDHVPLPTSSLPNPPHWHNRRPRNHNRPPPPAHPQSRPSLHHRHLPLSVESLQIRSQGVLIPRTRLCSPRDSRSCSNHA